MVRLIPRAAAVAATAAALLIGACSHTPEHRPELDADYPADLVAYMGQRGCKPDRAAMTGRRLGTKPPYAYGFLEREGAAMWCYRERGGRRNVLLLRKPSESYFACRDELETMLPIGGLSIGTASFINTLDGFTRVDGRNTAALTGGIDLPAAHIVSTHPGDVIVFACHDGQWWSYRFK